MSYKDTFIQVAADCPLTHSVVPVAKGDKKPLHVLQYELLIQHPYTYTHEDLIFEVYVRQHALSADEIQMRRLRFATPYSKKASLACGHPCSRRSMAGAHITTTTA